MNREEKIKALIEKDIDMIFDGHPERSIYEMLENGVRGYNNWTDQEINEAYQEFIDYTEC